MPRVTWVGDNSKIVGDTSVSRQQHSHYIIQADTDRFEAPFVGRCYSSFTHSEILFPGVDIYSPMVADTYRRSYRTLLSLIQHN